MCINCAVTFGSPIILINKIILIEIIIIMTGCSWKSRLILADRSPAMITIVISFIIKIIITMAIIIIIKIIITTGYSWQRRLILADRSPGTITGCLDSTSTRHRRTFQDTSSSFGNAGLKSSILVPVRIVYSFSLRLCIVESSFMCKLL